VRNPSGVVVPDFAAKLPGRGCWLTATRTTMVSAIKKNAFSRGFQDSKAHTDIQMPEAFADDLMVQQQRRVMDALGLCRRSGELVTGFDKVASSVKTGLAGDMVIIASNAGADGTTKLISAASRQNVIVAHVFDSETLSQASGFDGIGYLFVSAGRTRKTGGQPGQRVIYEIIRFLALSGEEIVMSKEN